MKKQLYCLLCKTPGYSRSRVWYKEIMVLSVAPNIRTGPKIWICRKCIKKHSKLSDEGFLELILEVRQQKS